MNRSAICTLFEGNYHFGLGALVNSLARYGYTGNIYAGYRGDLPPWSSGEVHEVKDGPSIHFISLDTPHHLTNHKPDFMLRVLDGPGTAASALFYFDPDIILKSHWNFFEKWVSSGICGCEDVNSPLDPSHPRRMAWKNYFKPRGILLDSFISIYINGGFVGVSAEHRGFLELWKKIQETMADDIGGLSAANIGGGVMNGNQNHPGYCFNKTDQDALNAALMAWPGPYSLMGKDAMDFVSGGYLMSHALGSPKPWATSYLRRAFLGITPSRADKEFWKHVEGPVPLFPESVRRSRQRSLSIAALLGRFYRRSDS